MDFCSNEQQNFEMLIHRPEYADLFASYSGVKVTSVKDGVARGELTIEKHNLNPMGIVHGGCLATLADTVAGTAVACQQGCMCVTVNYCFNFLRPAKGTGKKIYCRAEPEKLGRTLCVYGVTLTDDDGKEIAVGTFTFFRAEK